MKRKTMLLFAAALSVLAFAALPAVASAFTTTPVFSLEEGKSFPQEFSGTGGAGVLYRQGSGTTVNCTSSTVTGKVTDPHTGSLSVLFHGCTESLLGSKCTTSGQASGDIATTTLEFHTVYLKPADPEKPHERPGILITDNAGHSATFTCAGGLVKIEVRGSVLGTMTAPAFKEFSNSTTLDVSATAEGQQHTETVEGESFGLESRQNGGAWVKAYESAGSTTVNLAGGVKATTTTETP